MGFDEFSVKSEKEVQSYTTFESLGADESATCVSKATGSFKGCWNAGVNAFDAAPGIYPRDDAGPGACTLRQADPTFYLFPVLTLPSTSIDSSLAAKLVKFSADYQSNGPYSLPTGSFGLITG